MSRKTASLVAVRDGKITDEALGLIQRKANDAAKRVESGRPIEEILKGFQDVLEGQSIVGPHFVWKRLEIGTHKNVKSLRKAVLESGSRISNWADGILNKTELSKSKDCLDLVVLSVEELGFPQGARLEDIYKAANNRGLDLCPAEVGPQLRYQYPDQPRGEWFLIAMDPIYGSGGDPLLFYVGHYDIGRWLGAYYGRPGYFWDANVRFVFVCRK